jgi:hypothetical protein
MADRENAGYSPHSYKKHKLLWRAAYGQACAYRYTHPNARVAIIDMHAADGEGVEMPQLDLFGPAPTYPTPLLATRLAETIGNADVFLCEKLAYKRQALALTFPQATILKDHADITAALRPEHRWALVLNDPCGYADHGIDTLQQLGTRMRLDTLIVFNEGALRQLLGMKDIPATPDAPHVARIRAVRPKYAWMAEPHNWAQALGARHMARTVLIKASARFHYRVLVLSHTLSQALRPPTWEHVL